MSKVLFCSLLLTLSACQTELASYRSIQGSTMGTTYNIIVEAADHQKLKADIDHLLLDINSAVSTYEPDAIISKFNNSYSDYLSMLESEHYDYFIENYDISATINKISNGAFDPTVMPIVNYWGFGYTGKKKVFSVDTNVVEQIMRHVGFEKLTKKKNTISKIDPKVELDFSGVAKGYAVDKISEYLENKHILNYYVEIGGELFGKGKNEAGTIWRTGLSVPREGATQDDFQQIIEVSDKGIATSGNYRNYYRSNGEIFSHTINPKTGFPERSKLLSATIIARSCAFADGFATACMVLGLEKSIEMINLQEEIDGILIFDNGSEDFQVFDSTKK